LNIGLVLIRFMKTVKLVDGVGMEHQSSVGYSGGYKTA
jgi:hypothetical protein